MNTNPNKLIANLFFLLAVLLSSGSVSSCSAQTQGGIADSQIPKSNYPNSALPNTDSAGNCGSASDVQSFPDKKETNLHKAAAKRDKAGIIAALKNKVDVNQKDSYGNTALIIALTQKIPEPSESRQAVIADRKKQAEAVLEIAEILLRRGADANIKGLDGKTALIRAVLADESIVSNLLNLLTKHKADINLQDNQGYTALMEAARTNRIKAVAFLLEKGADRELKNCEGKTALMIAEEYKFTDITKILRQTSR